MSIFFLIKKEELKMQKIIVKPNKEGRIFIKLYGTEYEIIVDKLVEKTTKASKKTEDGE